MITKTPTASPARPVMARMMLTAAPMPTEMNGFTCGSVVLKLLAAMKEEKQAGGNAAMARGNITHLARPSPSTTGIILKAFMPAVARDGLAASSVLP